MPPIARLVAAARERHPLNDWVLARIVAAIFIFDCFLVTLLKA